MKRPYSIFSGPSSMVAGCNHCHHVERVPRGRNPGSAWGWTSRNHLTRLMNAHVREKHPDLPRK